MPPAPDGFFVLANRIEAGVWAALACVVAVAAVARPSVRLRLLALCGLLFLFGLSDLVETHTGAWWRPWWLLLWKAICVAGIGLLTAWSWRSLKAVPTNPSG